MTVGGCTQWVQGACKADAPCEKGECVSLWGQTYDVTVVKATLPSEPEGGGTWDGFGGMPDPYVLVEVNDVAVCKTSTVQDTFTPSWNEQCSIKFAKGDTLTFHVMDEDLTSDDDVSWDYVTDLVSAIKKGNSGAPSGGVGVVWEIERSGQ